MELRALIFTSSGISSMVGSATLAGSVRNLKNPRSSTRSAAFRRTGASTLRSSMISMIVLMASTPFSLASLRTSASVRNMADVGPALLPDSPFFQGTAPALRASNWFWLMGRFATYLHTHRQPSGVSQLTG